MSVRAFFDAPAKEAATQVVKEIEAQTSAEVVVMLRPYSGHYRHVDYLMGFLLAVITLIFLLFYPEPFDDIMFPLDMVVAFGLGVLISSRWPWLRRVLTRTSWREAQVQLAAKGAFVDQGISRTRGRSGILIYISMLEKDVALVPDLGIPLKELEPGWSEAREAMRQALRGSGNLEAFLAGMRRLGPLLAGPLPVGEDDINELDDRVQ